MHGDVVKEIHKYPVIGRFLSPDPVLQDPANAQNYNKYSYVLNNPLKFTDPSGYVSEEWSYWQRANWFFMQSNSWSRYFHNTGLSEEMARECMGNKMASLYLNIFCIDNSSGGGGGGGGTGSGGGGGAPGGQSGASQSGGNNDYTSGAGLIDKDEKDPVNPFYHIKGDFNYNKGDWNYYDATYISDAGFFEITNSYLANPSDLMQALSTFFIEKGVGLVGLVYAPLGIIEFSFYTVFESCGFMGKIMSQKYLEEGEGKGIYVINVSSPGAVPRAAMFLASTNEMLGWYYTAIPGVNTIPYNSYYNLLNTLP